MAKRCISSVWLAEDISKICQECGLTITTDEADTWLLQNRKEFLEKLEDAGKRIIMDMFAKHIALKAVDRSSVDGRNAGTYIVKLAEDVYDMSRDAQHLLSTGIIRADDSRELFSSIWEWAKEFERSAYEKDDYMTEIESYGRTKLVKQYGQAEENRCLTLEEIDGRDLVYAECDRPGAPSGWRLVLPSKYSPSGKTEICNSSGVRSSAASLIACGWRFFCCNVRETICQSAEQLEVNK